jgi:beta-lactam-binding protein with PASTA domain
MKTKAIICAILSITFISTGAVQGYPQIIDLGTLAGYPASVGWSINSEGRIVGWVADNNSINSRACIFDAAGDGANIKLGDSNSAALGSNSSQIVGEANSIACIFNSAGSGVNISLGTLGGSTSGAQAINSSGQIVGWAQGGSSYWLACIFDNTGGGANKGLGTLGGYISQALANNNSKIIGYADNYSNYERACIFDPTGDSNNNIDLGTLGGDSSLAWSINSNNQIVGWAFNDSLRYHACLFSSTGDGNNIDLGGLAADGNSEAYCINNNGWIVGYAENSAKQTRACLFDKTGGGNNIDLNILLNPNSGWTLKYAYSINNNGLIVGQGIHNGQQHAFVLAITALTLTKPYSVGTGDSNSPYQIDSVADWQQLMTTSADWDKHFIMMTDINLHGVALTPVGNDSIQFTGVFNGNNRIIRNADMNSPADDLIGLFGYLGSGGQVHNLGIENVKITGYYFVGGLAGYNDNDSGGIVNCYSTGTISGYREVGGLVGWNDGSISNCYSASTVGGTSNVGGLVGYSSGGTASNSFWDVNSSGRSTSAGGTGKTTAQMQDANTFLNAGWDFVGETVNGTLDFWTIAPTQYPHLTWQANSATVPNVISMAQVDAETAITAAGLVVGIRTNSCSDTVPAGQVIGQSPAGGKVVWRGMPVNIVISTGPPITVPNVVSMAQTDAANAIAAAGLVVGTRTNSFSDTVPAGQVISQSPASGIVVWRGTKVNIVISIGSHYSGGAGTQTNPYQIASVADWQKLMFASADWNSYFILTADINLQGITLTPVGNDSIQFHGVFNGNNHIIRNAVMTADLAGLFGYLGSGGRIYNLGVNDVNITGGSYCVGGLAGYNYYGSISNCYLTGTVSGNLNVGGLVGYLDNGNITNCHSTAAVSGSYNYVGGLVGENNGGSISNCYSTGAVRGYQEVGGLVGSNYSGSISNCYSIGTVTCTSVIYSDTGGLVGDSSWGTVISNCYSTGAVSGSTSYVGGLVGVRFPSIISGSFWDVNSSGKTTSAGGTGKTTAQMKDPNTFLNAGWDFVGETVNGTLDYWTQGAGYYPYLTWQTDIVTIPNVVSMAQTDAENAIAAAGLVVGTRTYSYNYTIPQGCIISQSLAAGIAVPHGTTVNIVISIGSHYSSGTGTQANPYQIAAAADWQRLMITSADWNSYFILTADINLQGMTLTPVGNDSIQFHGVFNGNKHIIRNVDMSPANYTGLFGYLGSGCQIYNLGVKDVNITGNYFVGGLAGYNDSGSISNCYSTGTVSGYREVGGLVGHNDSGYIWDCYSTCDVSSYQSVGGLVGKNYSGISYCYSTGIVSGSSNVGGLVGYNGGSVSGSFWDINSSGWSTSAGGTGKTTAQMKTRSTFTNAGWDFVGEIVNGPNDVWRMCVDGLNYPKLSWQFLPGDFVCPDGVDIFDLAAFSDHWLLAGAPYDINNDGIVNFLDFALLAENWLKGN